METWIITCNLEYYNVVAAFKALPEIDWKQSNNIAVGDTIYIYVGAPKSCLKFQCKAVMADMDSAEVDDSEYQRNNAVYGNSGRYMRLRLVKEFPDDLLTREELMRHGLRTIQGPSRVRNELQDYINERILKIDSRDMTDEKSKYSVSDSVWIAAALLSIDMFTKKPNAKAADYYFKQSVIVSKAQDYADGTVDAARVSWWTCADAPRHTYSYLRGDNEEDKTLRRLTSVNELAGEKVIPDTLTEADETIFTINGHNYSMNQLLHFVKKQYRPMKDKKYGFDKICSFLSDYAGKHYIQPLKAGAQAEYMRNLKTSGKKARELFIAFGREVINAFPDLELVSCSNWINQGQRVMEYIWIELKNTKWKEYPQSVSISLEMHSDELPGDGFFISVRSEAKDVICKPEDYKRQMRVWDYPLNANMQYKMTSKRGEIGYYKDKSSLETLFTLNQISKLELVEIIENPLDADQNGTITEQLIRAISEIKPVYEYIMQDEKEEWWPSLSEYDPGISTEQYRQLFVNQNIVHKEWLEAIYEMYQMPGHLATCKQLGEQYGHTPAHYISYLTSSAENIQKATDCTTPAGEENAKYWPILFYGRYSSDKSQGNYIWKMRDKVQKAVEMLVEEGVFKKEDDMVHFDHNLILYGPPGTGKTYKSVIYAVAICEGKSIEAIEKLPYAEILDRYNELKENGRIAFTTFHQSYGYEEFIEGIKPKLNIESDAIGYTIEDGIFKEFCLRAKNVKVQAPGQTLLKERPRIWGMILGGPGDTDLKKECFERNEIRLGWSEVDDTDVEGDFYGDSNSSWQAKHMVYDFKNVMEIGDIVVIEKNNSSIDAIGVITGEYQFDKSLAAYPRKRKVEWLLKGIDQDMIPYLPNGRKQLSRFSLFAFDNIGMDVISNILNEYSASPIMEIEQEKKPYVFIIDEINRGNISKIFGELITLIEDTKRGGASEAMEAILPYSGEPFTVPNNVYILGTMNTADRSIALMDTALRRRFKFTEMMPEPKVLNDLSIGTIRIGEDYLNISGMLEVINKRIEYLFDREHTIGHAFFTRLKESASLETLADIFEKNVIPLLQEYFYEDYEKIQLVLGDNDKEKEFKFILDYPVVINDIFNGDPDIDLPEKGYKIQKDAFMKLDSYKKIAKGL